MLAVRVTLLDWLLPPTLPLPLESNCTLISADSPGGIGSLGQDGTVHPQLPLALEMNIPFVLVRKVGKLPFDTIQYSYDLEYGSATVEMHVDSIKPNWNVFVHDDLLATGGTAIAAAELIKQQGGNVAGFGFIIELGFLNGTERLKDYSKNIINLATY